MLSFFGSKQDKMCDGISRRGFLKVGTLGIGGLTLADLFRQQARGGQNMPARTKSVIMIYLYGGPSHLDMYDLKPDAPAEYRGEFKPIRTKVPGMDICELMPLQAKIADQMTIIRNMHFEDDSHSPPELFTGFPVKFTGGSFSAVKHPAMGSVISRMRSDAGIRSDLPDFVVLHHHSDIPYRPDAFPAFLGPAHRPFVADPARLETLRLAKGMNLDDLQDRERLLRSFVGHAMRSIWIRNRTR